MKKLDSKVVQTRKDQVCVECGKQIPAKSSMRVYLDMRPSDKFDEYKRAYICLDCEKYYKRKDPKVF